MLVAQRLIGQMSYGAALTEMMTRFKISRSSCVRAIKLARMLMAQEEEAERPQAKARYVHRLERIADAAEDKGQFGDAVRAYRELIHLRGLAEPDAASMSPSKRAAYANLTDAQIDALAALEEAQLEAEPVASSSSNSEPN